MTRGRSTQMRGAALASALVGVLAALGACSAVEAPEDPSPCAAVFSEARCGAIRDAAAALLSTHREDIVALMIVPESPYQVIDGQRVLVVRSGGGLVHVLATMADGSTKAVNISCIGVTMTPACLEPPRLIASSPGEGYRDTPVGASPVPPPHPDALAAATELRIERMDIPIDRVGRYEVRLGEASLPNGLLTNAEFELVDDWPAGVTIIDGNVRMEVHSLVTGERLFNIFEHGWREGTEDVEAVLLFNVFRFEPGAVLSIRNVIVE